MFSANASYSVTSCTAGPSKSEGSKHSGSKFSMKVSVQNQLQAFAHLRAKDPVKAKLKYDRGEMLISLAQDGRLSKLTQFIHGIEEGDILTYHVVKAYKAALMGGHLIIAALIIDEGYPFNRSSVPAVLLEIMGEVTDEKCYDILSFLLSKDYDVNLAAQGTWMTALHVAIRYGHLNTAKLLIENNADVNAVAEGDIMPLALAHKLMSIHNDQGDSYGHKEIILGELPEELEANRNQWKERGVAIRDFVKLLIAEGARSSWRRDADRAREARDRSSVTTSLPVVEEPPKPRLVSRAGTVNKANALTLEEAREAIAKAKAMAKAQAEHDTQNQSVFDPKTTSATLSTVSFSSSSSSVMGAGPTGVPLPSMAADSKVTKGSDKVVESTRAPRFVVSELIESDPVTDSGTVQDRQGRGAGQAKDGNTAPKGLNDAAATETKQTSSRGSHGMQHGNGVDGVIVAKSDDGGRLFGTG